MTMTSRFTLRSVDIDGRGPRSRAGQAFLDIHWNREPGVLDRSNKERALLQVAFALR